MRLLAVCAAAAIGLPALVVGQQFEGRLGEGDPIVPTDGSYYRLHEFSAQQGEELFIDLMSDDFDAFLIVHSPTGEIFRDDDGGDGLNSRLTITANASGAWKGYANTVNRGETGNYQLAVQRFAADALEERVFVDSLGTDSPSLPDTGARFGEHTIEAQAGQWIIVDLAADDFDALLHVHSPSGTTFTDDDGGEGTNSRIRVRADQGGVWRLVATSYQADGLGAYRLTTRITKP